MIKTFIILILANLVSGFFSCTTSKPILRPAPLIYVMTLQEATEHILKLEYQYDSLLKTAVYPDSTQYDFINGVMKLKNVQSFMTLRVLDSLIVGRSKDTTHGHGPDSTIHAD